MIQIPYFLGRYILPYFRAGPRKVEPIASPPSSKPLRKEKEEGKKNKNIDIWV